MGEGIYLTGFPCPPSDNALYRNVQRIGRVKTGQYKQYRHDVEVWAWKNMGPLRELKAFCVHEPLLAISIILKMPPDRFWTKTKKVKRMDASNRLKASLDELSRLIGLDDSHFFHVSITKQADVNTCLDIYIRTHELFER